ncbi:DUF4163 domain-containing protein [Parerythrobacter aestuarii]|uniref:DUF4163 domain-containing protein n=1 Tax=Parerythrobacter aestuarii TaxID=3020909 RepID=UPI0024DE62F0|nr:DUF4163 domain-containing protein [Parerythrobacter aestuarii]
MMRFAVLIAPAMVLAACDLSGEATDGAGKDDGAAVATPAPTASASAAPDAETPVEAVNISEESALFSFEFAYPKEVAAIPALKARLDKDMADGRAALESQARQASADSKEQGFPYNAYAEGTEWQVVANTPRYLSLSAQIYSYTGGAHPNHGTSALVWDRESNRALKPVDFFVSPDALNGAVEKAYCAELNRLRAERRGEVDGSGYFSECPGVGELTVLLGSSNRKAFNRIGFIADPYVAGSYAEGDYEVTLPVTKEILAAVRPAFRDAFAVR